MLSRGEGRLADRVKSYDAPGSPKGAKKLSLGVRGVRVQRFSKIPNVRKREYQTTQAGYHLLL